MAARRGRRKREGGQSLVELALITPVLILVLVGLVEIGSALNSYLTIVASARDGARLGMAGSVDDTAIRDLIDKETERLGGSVPNSCSPGAAGICITRAAGPPPASVKVDVCYDHDLVLGVPGLIAGPIKICSSTVMRISQ